MAHAGAGGSGPGELTMDRERQDRRRRLEQFTPLLRFVTQCQNMLLTVTHRPHLSLANQ